MQILQHPAYLLHSFHTVLEVARLLPVGVLQPAQRLRALPLRRLRPLSRSPRVLCLQGTRVKDAPTIGAAHSIDDKCTPSEVLLPGLPCIQAWSISVSFTRCPPCPAYRLGQSLCHSHGARPGLLAELATSPWHQVLA